MPYWISSTADTHAVKPSNEEMAHMSPAAQTDNGRILAKELIAGIKRNARLHDYQPLVVLAGRDLARVRCASLFGYADRNNQIADVSNFPLQHPDPETCNSSGRTSPTCRHIALT